MFDEAREDHAHIARRLVSEPIAWLGTTQPDGRPHHVPVWFLWQDASAIVFSPPGARKVRNLRVHPACVLTLDSADGGDDIVIVEGRAELLDRHARDFMPLAFQEKYAGLVEKADFNTWAETFSLPIIVTVTRVVAWSKPGGQLRYTVVAPAR